MSAPLASLRLCLVGTFLGILTVSALAQTEIHLETARGTCVAVTDADGLHVPNLIVHGKGVTLSGEGCGTGAGAPSVNAKVIVPENAVEKESFTVSWTPGPDAESCVFTGTRATNWPAGSLACGSASACAGAKTASVNVDRPGTYGFGIHCSTGVEVSRSVTVSPSEAALDPFHLVGSGTSEMGSIYALSWASITASTCTGTAKRNGASATLAGWTDRNHAGATAASFSFPSTGSYELTLSCSTTGGTVASHPKAVDVSSPTSPDCPSGRQTAATVCYSYNGPSDCKVNQSVTEFKEVFGKITANGIPIAFPGERYDAIIRDFRKDQYIALKFKVPASVDGKSGFLSKGSTLSGPNLDVTISKQCGQFEVVDPAIPACKVTNVWSAQQIAKWGLTSDPRNCKLEVGQEYFMNIRASDPSSTHAHCTGSSCMTSILNRPPSD